MVDLSFLEKFTKGDVKKMVRYIGLYLDETPKSFAKMKQNLEAKNWNQLRINAHSLKPQTDFVGSHPLKEILVQIEDGIAKGEIEQMEYYFSQAFKIFLESKEILEGVLKDLGQD